MLYEQRKDAEAIQRWRSVLTIRPTAAEPMLALAAALNAQDPGNGESLDLAKRALAGDPNYVLSSYQQEQLWGSRLRQATSVLLANASLKGDVERAQANADAEPPTEEVAPKPVDTPPVEPTGTPKMPLPPKDPCGSLRDNPRYVDCRFDLLDRLRTSPKTQSTEN